MEAEAMAGEKRPLEETAEESEAKRPETGEPPADAPTGGEDAPPAADDGAAPPPAAEGAAAADAAAAAAAAVPAAGKPAIAPHQEEAALQSEVAWLRQTNAALQTQLAQLQQQHMALTAAAAQQAQQQQAQQAQQQQAHHAQQQARSPAPAPSVKHNQAWTEQLNPENGTTYYWNSQTGASTYERPPDFNPHLANSETSSSNPLPQTKGPPGANLFVVRKMRRGEYDEFNDEDLRREFSKYGEVTRAAMTIDKENGWSKGFGFVSFGTVAEADAAMNAVHGSWMAGREMKVEKTHDG